jgi:hypothetical protein
MGIVNQSQAQAQQMLQVAQAAAPPSALPMMPAGQVVDYDEYDDEDDDEENGQPAGFFDRMADTIENGTGIINAISGAIGGQPPQQPGPAPLPPPPGYGAPPPRPMPPQPQHHWQPRPAPRPVPRPPATPRQGNPMPTNNNPLAVLRESFGGRRLISKVWKKFLSNPPADPYAVGQEVREKILDSVEDGETWLVKATDENVSDLMAQTADTDVKVQRMGTERGEQWILHFAAGIRAEE